MSTPPGAVGPAGGHDLSAAETPAASFRGAQLSFGRRRLWSGLDLEIARGEYIAVLGGNGTGKTSLLRVLLGLLPLSAGTVEVGGRPARRGSTEIGYVPQQRAFAGDAPMRARDLVALGVDGHRWGPRLLGRRDLRRRVDEALERVGALDYADEPVGALSGGEQQRLRVAQALVTDPGLLLLDEALLSLDLTHQREVADLVVEQKRRTGAAVVFVTHDINPIIDDVDRVLYLANGSFRIGTPREVLRSEVLSELYGTQIEVAEVAGRVIVVGAEREDAHHDHELPDHHEDPHAEPARGRRARGGEGR